MIHGYAAHRAGAELQNYQYTPEELGEHAVEVAITHCGICHSDLHLIDDDWKISRYPFIPGHEIVGTVTAKGKAVEELSLGQRVGIGWQCGCCFSCHWCEEGKEHLCSRNQATCVGRNGGYADAIRVDSRFAFSLPEQLPSDKAAPLLCGGATVFSPMLHHGIAPGDKVAVIGIGGLGHLALQFAAAMGCEVTAISSHKEKAAEAAALGAAHFLDSSDSGAMKELRGRFAFILNTAFANLDWQSYVDLLAPHGKLCFVGAASAPLNILPSTLIHGEKWVGGSAIGSRETIKTMLSFAAENGIAAQTVLYPLADVNKALSDLRAGTVRYRAVLTME